MTLLPLITSSHNPFFRKCLQLRESRKRRQSGQFLIDGAVEICRAIAAGLNVERVLSDDQILPSELHELVTSSPLLEKLSYGQHSNQPIAVVTTPSLSLHSLNLDSNSLVLVLDRTEKPGNLGACLRSAAAGGASAVVLTDPICDPFNANAIRASRGTMFRVPMAMATASEFIKLAREIQLPLLAARVDATKSLWEINLERGTAMVFGNEAEGLGRDWAGASIDSFTIPMTSKADSLNLSISAAVTLYEAFRQRSRREI
jgi:RNA methyltransferase, TrmH family